MADQVLVDAVPRIDLANLIEELKTKSRESLLEAIEVYQERLLDELCGKKRKPNGTYRRAFLDLTALYIMPSFESYMRSSFGR